MALEFTNAGDEATAMQRAHEFGCLPETVLALVVLTDYRIVGSAAQGGILQIESVWPAAWRVQAARSHRALAAGCVDDIDLILRIFYEWQRAKDADGWCSTWWVNPATLHQVESDTASIFGALASSGPLGMRRPVDPARAPQVRRALADAFEDSFYSRVAPNRYRPIGDGDGENPTFALSPAVLCEPGEQIIGLGTDRVAGMIEHVISVDETATPPHEDVLAPVRHQWPVGSILEIETLGSVSAGRMVTDILTLHRGFPYPEGAPPRATELTPHTPELLAVPTNPSAPIDGASRLRVRVTGYRVSDSAQAILVVDPLAADAPIDPADHPDLATWDDIEVAVRGVTSDHLEELLELGRIDCYGSFFVPLSAGLSATDHTFGSRLIEGAQLTARVLPEPPTGQSLTVSLLPEAVRHLEGMAGINNKAPVPARVVNNDGPFGAVTVELIHQDADNGLSHRFVVERGRLMERFSPVVGDEVDVILRPDRSTERQRLRADKRLIDFAERNSETFSVANGWLELGPAPPDIASVLALLTIDESPEWERNVVWLYEDNLHLEAALVGPKGDSQLAEIAATLPGFLLGKSPRSRDDEQPPTAPSSQYPTVEPVAHDHVSVERNVVEHDVAERDPAALGHVDDNVVTEATPVEVVEQPVVAPAVPTGDVRRMIARLPQGAAVRIEGPDGAALAELRAGKKVLAVVLADDLITVVGETGRAVRSVMAEVQRLILPAKGRLILPPGGAKRLIGIDGTTLRALQVRTGCQAIQPEDGDLWVVEGPSHAAVKEFMRLASEQVPGVVGRATGMEDAEMLVDDSIPASEAAALIEAQNASVALRTAAVRHMIAQEPPPPEVVEPEEMVEEARPDRPPIKPLSHGPKGRRNSEAKSARRAAKAEARAARRTAKAEAKALAAQERAERKAKPKRKPEVVESEETLTAAAIDDGEALPEIRPKTRGLGIGSILLRIVLVLVAVAAVAALAWYAADFLAEEDAVPTSSTVDPAAVDPAAIAPVEIVAPVGPEFASIVDRGAGEPAGCWLAVMATWTSDEQAADGVARLQAAGLPAAAVSSELVPNWTANRTVGVVAVETSAQATSALERALSVGFSGVAVRSTVDACTGLDIVPAGAVLGFIDVPANDPDVVAIHWLANTGLLATCNPPESDRFCPDAPVTQKELSSVLAAALINPPAPSNSGAPATNGELNAALNIGDQADPAPLTRRSLADTLLLAHRTQSN